MSSTIDNNQLIDFNQTEQQQCENDEKKNAFSMEVKDVDDDKIVKKKTKLLIWKAEKQRKKKAERKNQRPTFKTSVLPRHKYYSPPIKFLTKKKLTMKTSKRVKLSAAVTITSTKNKVIKKINNKTILPSSTSSTFLSSFRSSSESEPSSLLSSSSSSFRSSSSSESESSESELESSAAKTQVEKLPVNQVKTTTETIQFDTTPTPSTSSIKTLSDSVKSSSHESQLSSSKDIETSIKISPIDVAKIHESVAVEEKKLLLETSMKWSKLKNDIEFSADEILYVNTEIARNIILFNKELSRFENTIAGYEPRLQTYICPKLRRC